MWEGLAIKADLELLCHLHVLPPKEHAVTFPNTKLHSPLKGPTLHHTHHPYEVRVYHLITEISHHPQQQVVCERLPPHSVHRLKVVQQII